LQSSPSVKISVLELAIRSSVCHFQNPICTSSKLDVTPDKWESLRPVQGSGI